MSEPKWTNISVIVPFYNAEKYIVDSVEALLLQNYPPKHYEIIMIDNNSTDSSAAMVQRFPRIQLLMEKKQGAYAARNRGIQHAKGEILAFLDSDCKPPPTWLQAIAAAMSNPRIGIVIGKIHFGADSSALTMLEAHDDERKNYIFNSKEKEIYYGQAGNMAVRKNLFDEIGLFLERHRGSDTIFVRQSAEQFSWEIVRYVPAAQVRHLEINNLSIFYRKCFIYGRSRQQHGHIASVRPLTLRERFLIFQRAVQKKHYSWMEALLFFGLITLAAAAWSAGSICAAFDRQAKSSRTQH